MLFGSHCFSPLEEEIKRKQLMKKELREIDEFKKCITEIVENYIKCIDTKLSTQDLKIKQATDYMVDKITETAIDIINKGIEDGRFAVAVEYNEDTESLNVVATGGV